MRLFRKKENKKVENFSSHKLLEKFEYILNRNKVTELMELLGNTKQLIWRNFISGISKGIGIGIGFSVLTAVIIYFLQRIVKLNIPIIGQYISDIVDIVKNNNIH